MKTLSLKKIGVDMGFLVVTDNKGIAFRINSKLIMTYGETSNDHGYHTSFTMQNGSVLKCREIADEVDLALDEMGDICPVAGTQGDDDEG